MIGSALHATKLTSVKEKDLLHALRKVPNAEFRKASEAMFAKYNPSVQWPFQPVIDGHGGMIATAPILALRAGKFHKVPILLGFNTNEGAMFVPKRVNEGRQFKDFFTTLLPGLRSLDIDKLAEVYPDPNLDPESPYVETRPGLGKQFKRLEQAYGQYAYIAPVRQTAHYFSEAEDDKTPWGSPPVYLYHFAAESSVNGGADHGSQGPWSSYMPDKRDKGKVIDEIAGSMHAYWASFVVSGDPNAVKGRWEKRIHWPMYKEELGSKVMVFGEGNVELSTGGKKGIAVQVKDDVFAAEESKFWWARTELFEF
jgi:acetylcholinesterase